MRTAVSVLIAVGGILAATAGFGESATGPAPLRTLYVAPNGNDTWSGGKAEPGAPDGPLATLIGARDAVRRAKAAGEAGPIRVVVRDGVYPITEPIVFGPEDSGSLKAPIGYEAEAGAKPVISGGRIVAGWKQEGKFWTADLPDVKAGKWSFSALWVNGKRRTPARSPNEGFFMTAAKAPAVKDTATGKETPSTTSFEYAPGDLKKWEDLDGALVVVLHSWETSFHHVASLDDDKHIVTFTGPAVWPFMQWEPKQRYFVQNTFEGLDQPGEWYLNQKQGKLYYIPAEGEDMAHAEVIAPVAQQLVLLQGSPAEGKFVEHLNFKGLRFAYSEFAIPAKGYSDPQAAVGTTAAFQATGARRCLVENCEVAHVGAYGLWLRAGCQDNRVAHNEMRDLGAGGVRIGEPASPKTPNEAADRNVVDNNFLHDGGHTFLSGVGVFIARCSWNTVSHNEISDFGYTGVSVGWSWGYDPSSANHNLIEYNHIHHIGAGGMSDMGGIYTLGVAPGTVLRYNLIHDISSVLYGGWGIYPDEGSSNLLIENNVVYNTNTGGFHQHYGRDNWVRNNIFAFSREGQVIRSREEEHISFYFERNIVYFNNGKLLGSNWKNGNFWIDGNCYWDTSNPAITFSGASLDEWRARGKDVRSIIADPKFENAEQQDFRLKADSPAIALGFVPIDISGAGLYGDKAWVETPGKTPRPK